MMLISYLLGSYPQLHLCDIRTLWYPYHSIGKDIKSNHKTL